MARYDSDAMTVQEVAEYLRVSYSKVRKLCALNSIPHLRLGKRIVMHKHKIDQWVESNTTGEVEK